MDRDKIIQLAVSLIMIAVMLFGRSVSYPDNLHNLHGLPLAWGTHQLVTIEGPVDYWLVTTGEEGEPGINGAIMHRRDPSESTINTIEVISLDDSLVKIENAGGETVAQKIAVPGVGYMAYCKDPQGNTFGLMQTDPDAK